MRGARLDRRWLGLLILVLVVLAAAVLPSIIGRTVPGAAQAVPVPGPPQVGDCLTAPLDQSGRYQHYQPLTLAPCRADRFGEVVAVLPHQHPATLGAPMMPSPDDGSLVSADPDQQSCSDALMSYVGLTRGTDQHWVIESGWQPVTPLDLAISGPTDRQRAAGQNWLACVEYLHDADGGDSARYERSIRDAFGAGFKPAAFALCIDDDNLIDADTVPCGKAHTVEAFGSTNTDRPGLTQALLDRSCAALVAHLTGMADPTAGSVLRVEAVAVHSGTVKLQPGLGPASDGNGFAGCLVVAPAGRQLRGTLLGLGSRPVPFTS